MKSDKEIEDFIVQYQEIYEVGFKKIMEAENLYLDFMDTATPEDVERLRKKAQQCLDALLDKVGVKRQELPTNVLPFKPKNFN